ncbi:MAG: bifunctional hexulose-6-phosphate synthase/ribonuclease regulator [Candidatus Altiarchaeales archaeon IMC4]|nr:MAG: bifunctional hexulose-6-phosphate synthase/ribonuclease regulator [Candidatus Altiarchaeales archaeon IMC4]
MKLQVALDFVDLDRAVNVAKEAVAGGVDLIEAGTPLIKSAGLNSVRKLRAQFPDKKIVADMKITDVGRVEVEAAAKAGANIVTVLALTSDATIKETVKSAKNFGCEVMADLMNVRDIKKRAAEVEKMGVDYLCVHVGIDQQMEGQTPMKQLRDLSKTAKIPIAVAGGINSENVVNAVEAGASIIIVGGAITKAQDAKEAARRIKAAMSTGSPVTTELFKKYTSMDIVLAKVSTANISDAMHRAYSIDIKPLVEGTKIFGRAVTVRCAPGDWAKPVEAIDIAEKGDVIIIDSGGVGPAVWGELATESSIQKGIAGVIINGAARDTSDIRKLRFPLFARLVMSNAGEPKGIGEINVPVTISGKTINPGDWIIADDDGVMVIPKEDAMEVSNRAIDVLEKENRVRKEIKHGSTLSKVCHIREWECCA